MKVDNVKLKDLLEGSRQFVVPRFQRTYCWEKRHWDDLWNDLVELYDDKKYREHFMGVIVTMPVEMQPHGVNKFLLIDGQQRLTTILLILACIRDLIGDDGDLAEKIDKLYLQNQFTEESNRHKLLPTQIDVDSFRRILDCKEQIESSISEVYTQFSRRLRTSNDERESLNLEHFLDTMIERLIFASIVIDKEDNPYRIFHSLNGTGEALTQSDLIRNHIFMHIDDSDQEIAYNDYWLPIQSELDKRNKLDNFMVDFVLKDGEFISRNSVYDTIRHATSQAKDPKKYVQDLLENLAIYFGYYLRLVDPINEKDRRLSRLLSRLNSLRTTTPYPFLLNLYHEVDTGKLSKPRMCDILETIESFVVRRYFCRIHSRGLNLIFTRMYRSIVGEADIVRAAGQYLLVRKFPTDEEFIDGWIRYPVYGTGNQDRSRFVLESLETETKQNNEPVDLFHEDISREHIMPQTLSDEWRSMLGNDADTTHGNYVHTIGNLTLTGMNESMGNKPFAFKKEVFAQSSFAMNKHFENCATWNADAIVQRAHQLGEYALRLWKRPSN